LKTSGRKERDVKFIIYQSLYIFVIATLGYHGLNLFDITKDAPQRPGEDTLLVSQRYLDSLRNAGPKDDEQIIKKDSLTRILAEIESLKAKLEECEKKKPTIPDPGRIPALEREINRLQGQLSDCRAQLERCLNK
jgi:uncharacterized small protein (DUF1192 family)